MSKLPDNEYEEPTVRVETRWGKTRLGIQVSLVIMVGWLISYLGFWADRHNDERYVKQSDYQRDRRTDEELRTAKENAMLRRIDDQGMIMGEIKTDVKELLREARSK